MRVKAGKATSKYLGSLIFLILFFLNGAFPNAAFAFTSLNACARSKECLELIKDSSSSAVLAPTGAGFGSSTLSTTTNSGTVRTLVKGVTDFAIVTGPTAAYVGWHYWNEAHNGQAQNRARELYCAANPGDSVCTPFTGGQSPGVSYWAVATAVSSWNCQMLQNAYGFQFEYCDDSSGYGSFYDLSHRVGAGITDLKGPVQFLGFRQALDQFNQGCWFMDVLTADGYRSSYLAPSSNAFTLGVLAKLPSI